MQSPPDGTNAIDVHDLVADGARTVLTGGDTWADADAHCGTGPLRIHGRDIPVRATIETLDGLSARADREDLLRWLGGFTRAPRVAYVVHGEPAAARSLADAIRRRFRWDARVAEDGATVPLAAG